MWAVVGGSGEEGSQCLNSAQRDLPQIEATPVWSILSFILTTILHHPALPNMKKDFFPRLKSGNLLNFKSELTFSLPTRFQGLQPHSREGIKSDEGFSASAKVSDKYFGFFVLTKISPCFLKRPSDRRCSLQS